MERSPTDSAPGKSIPWNAAFTALMATVLGIAILSSTVLGIISRFLIDDLGMSRSQVGWLAAVVSVSAALTAPFAGNVADRIGGRNMAITVFAVSGLGLLFMSASPSFAILLVAGLVAGLGQAGANPSTNKLIRLHITKGRRGIVTGIKQSGVQIWLFIAGLVVPTLAISMGWRFAVRSFVLIPLIGIILILALIPGDVQDSDSSSSAARSRPLPPMIKWLGWQGLLVGIGSGSLITYLPLYAQEEIGLPVVTAGVLASVYGLSGFVGRLAFPHFGERARHSSVPMLLVTGIALAGGIAIWLSYALGAPALWIGAVLTGVLPAWTAIAMLSVITRVDQVQAGRASGVVARGFGLGLATGPPVFGISVDATGSYHLGLALMTASIMTATLLVILWRRSEDGPEQVSPST